MSTAKAIDRLFGRLSDTYGEEWSRKWGKTPIQDVKTLWAHELSAYATEDGLKMIAWALANLPEHAPNVIQFKTLVRSAPRPEKPLALRAPADPARVEKELALLGEMKKQVLLSGRGGPKEWAYVLKERAEKGHKLSAAQRSMYKAALELDDIG